MAGSAANKRKASSAKASEHAPQALIDQLEPRKGFGDPLPTDTDASFIRKSPSGLEGPRKLFHSSIGFVALGLWHMHTPIIYILYILGTGLIVITLADIWRFNSPWFAQQYEKRLGVLMRKSEKTKVNGVIWYIIGVMICLIFFPRDLAVLSVIILSWCDTSASVFGRLFGKYTPPLPFHGRLFASRKSLAGSLAAAATGAFAAYIFYGYLAEAGSEGDLSWIGNSNKDTNWTTFLGKSRVLPPTRLPQLPNPRSDIPLANLCVVTGIAGALAEGIEIWGLDDNLTISPMPGMLIWTFLYMLK